MNNDMNLGISSTESTRTSESSDMNYYASRSDIMPTSRTGNHLNHCILAHTYNHHLSYRALALGMVVYIEVSARRCPEWFRIGHFGRISDYMITVLEVGRMSLSRYT